MRAYADDQTACTETIQPLNLAVGRIADVELGARLNIAADEVMTANILVVDDDPTIREYVRLHLASANFEVQVAGDGATAYEMALLNPPDLILSDISMPYMDGFQFLEKIRANASLADIPIILLTQHSDASVFRRGMDLGADDFLAKPVRRNDLLTSISSRLKRLEGMRRPVENELPSPTQSISVSPLPALLATPRREAPATTLSALPPFELTSPELLPPLHFEAVAPVAMADGNILGSVLVSGIRNFSAFTAHLQPAEISELLNAYFVKACEPLLEQNGWVVKFAGDTVVAMFDGARGQHVSHAQRALKAALLMTNTAQQFDLWIKHRFSRPSLPTFSIGVGIHSGIICVASGAVADGQNETVETNISGETVELATYFEKLTKQLSWSIVASEDSIELAGTRIVSGQTSNTHLPSKLTGAGITEERSAKPADSLNIAEVMGLLPKADASEKNRLFYDSLQTAVVNNTEALANQRYAPAAHSMFELELKKIEDAALADHQTNSEIKLQGYRLIKKLGEGGMSQVFLAEHSATGAQHVLKLLHITEDDGGEMLQRFISEYALISQIDHPNVAKIFAQGFSTSHAYIAMEYFPGGDLRRLMNSDISVEVALAVLIQVAGALGAIHERGMVHRDMKPDNIMLRADGSLALADFGIATLKDTRLSITAHGEVFGTPAYIAPEQASAQHVDHRADLYALGVMFFELLTGKKPYRAANTQALLYQHVNLAIPELPLQFSHIQPLVDVMMAKNPDNRIANAGTLIDMALEISEQSF
jgi:serine/threonine-protein kinase PpkA